MMHQAGSDLSQLDPENAIAIVGPGNLSDMAEFMRAYQERRVFAIFDPGQSIPAWEAEELARAISRARMLISNEYELSMIMNNTGLSVVRMLRSVNVIITTKGDRGADIITRRGMVTVPAIPTDNAVDPTGAGGLLPGRPAGGTGAGPAGAAGGADGHRVRPLRGPGTWGRREYSFTPEEFNAKLEEHFGKEEEEG